MINNEQNVKKNKIDLIITILAVIIGVYHVISVLWGVVSYDKHKIIHIASGLIIVYLMTFQNTKRKRTKFNKIISIFFLFLSVVVSLYFLINYNDISTRFGIAETNDTIAGVIVIALVLEATRRAWGIVIPSIALLALLYGFFGQHLPGIFQHGGLSLSRLIGYSSTYFQGIYGSLTALSAREVFMFILFGATLQASGAINFFMRIAQGVGGNFRSGPAQAAIISSAALGSVSGNTTTNVATTGVVTIPLMIEKGYSREYAGGIEAAASTGGQIMPPVMGAAAFIMSNTTGIPYFDIIIIALLPSLIYFIFLAISVQIRSVKSNLPMSKSDNNETIKALKEDSYIMLSLVALVVALYLGIPVANSALYAIITLIILVFIKKIIIHKFNFKIILNEIWSIILESLKMGTINGVKLGLIMATLGIMVEMFVVTGFAQRVSFQMISMAGNSLPLLLLLVALTCLLFGLGMPTAGAYVTVSVLSAPALIEHDIPLITAHFFVFYYAIMSVVTPPVGTASLVAAGISNGDYWKTGLNAIRLALPGLALPIYFVYRSELLLQDASFFKSIVAFFVVLFSLIAISAILERYLVNKLNVWHIIALLTVIVLSFIPTYLSSFLSISTFLLVVIIQIIHNRRTAVIQ